MVKYGEITLTNNGWGIQNQKVRLLRPAFLIGTLALVVLRSALHMPSTFEKRRLRYLLPTRLPALLILALTGMASAVPVHPKPKLHPHVRPRAAAAKGRVVSAAARQTPVGPVALVAQVQHPVIGPKPLPPPAPPIIRGGPWTEPTYADSTNGDNIDGEDLEVRRAAVAALGPYNGSVVVVDSDTGRVLSMVNQKIALSSGFQPCSTIKVSVALAGLSEKVIQPATKLRLGGLGKMDLTYALAHSNNLYFSTLGEHLGFQKVSYYAHLFGYGEKAGLNILGEQPGHYPLAPPQNGGVGMLTSFGEEVLAALMSAVANGGTLYYLQYPRTPQEVSGFVPRVKRRLDIHQLIPVIEPGMRGAVEYGSAHRAREDAPIAGKTGTCSDNHTHLGWFGSFNETGKRKLVVVVLLTGGRPAIGPMAAGIAGDVYRRLEQEKYFAQEDSDPAEEIGAPQGPPRLIAVQKCCAQ
jgi:beta-lactamase class D